MLPKTTQATSTEVDGDFTVEVDGATVDDIPLPEAAEEPEKQTADSGAEEAQPEKAESDAGTVPEKAPRTERRMEKLIDTLKARTDEVSELRKQLDSFHSESPQQDAQLPPWVNPVPQGEITLDEFRAQVADTARGLVQTELAAFQSKVLQYEGYKEDLNKVEAKYPILNQDSEVYDAEKAKIVANLYQKASANDPKLRLADFVDQVMSFHQAGQETGKQELKKSVIKREAESAVTPTPAGSLPSSDSDWDSMTLKEKEAWMKANGIWDM